MFKSLNKKISTLLASAIIFTSAFFIGGIIVWQCQSYAIFSDFLTFLDNHQGFLTVLGWVSVFLIALYQQKAHLRNRAKMKVYEELYNLRKDLDEKNIELSVMLSPLGLPFIKMRYAGKTSDSPVLRNAEALRHWNNYLSELFQKTQPFTASYLKLWVHSEMWIGVMPELKTAKNLLFSEFSQLDEALYKYYRYLQSLSIKDYNWKLWNKEEIKTKADALKDKFNIVASGYLDDFMGLVHNRLVASLLGHKKQPRETFNLERFKKSFKYKILTEYGFVEKSYSPKPSKVE